MYNLLFLLLFCAALCDLKYSKIPNSLILLGFSSVLSLLLIQQLYIRAIKGVFAGALIFSFLFMFYQLRILGAGDIKLLMVLPMFLSVNDFFLIIIISFSFTIIICGFLNILQSIRITTKTRLPLGISLLYGYGFWYIYYFFEGR